MFNRWLLIGVCLSASMLINSAQAANSVDLKIAGKLLVGSCSPSLENGGVVDFGHIPWGNLSKTDTNQLGSKMMTLTISCTTNLAVAFGPTDNRGDSRMAILIKNAKQDNSDLTPWYPETFGLGKTSGGVNLGGLAIAPMYSETKVDGTDATLIRTQSIDASPIVWDTTEALMDYGSRRFTPAAKSTAVPLPFKEAVIPLKVSAALQGIDTLALTDATNLDGSVTLSLYYL